MSEKIRVHFLGASRTVTGSKYLIEYSGKKLLVDCGLFQGEKKLRTRNWAPFPIDPSTIDCVVLTHAHLDHTGYLPRLVKAGFKGPIYCTAPTKELTKYILLDSARLQEEEAYYANKVGSTKHKPAKALYTTQDAELALSKLKVIPRGQYTEVLSGMSVLPLSTGHILGAVSLSFSIGNRRLVFSGDIGRYSVPILPDPRPVEHGDLFVCESTYGDKLHPEGSIENDLVRLIKHVAEKKGPLLIPSFAIGRAQHLLYAIGKLEREGKIPALPLFVDSPMAIDATDTYRKFKYDYDEEAEAALKVSGDPLRTKYTKFYKSSNESKTLNHLKGAAIIIAGSGMVTGGRILHHLKNWLPHEIATVAFVGFQAAETRGRKLLNGDPTLKIYGSIIPVKAEILTITGLSAHGDRSELTRWIKSSSGSPTLTKIVHGESATTEIFSKHLQQTFDMDASPAEPNEIVEV